MSDLEQIAGIGKKRANELAIKGITSFADLARADADFLEQTMEVSRGQIDRWQQEAAQLTKSRQFIAVGRLRHRPSGRSIPDGKPVDLSHLDEPAIRQLVAQGVVREVIGENHD